MMSQNPLDYAEVIEVDADEIQGALAALDELDDERDRRRERHLSARLLVRVARALDLDPTRLDPTALGDLDPEAVAESVAQAVAQAVALDLGCPESCPSYARLIEAYSTA